MKILVLVLLAILPALPAAADDTDTSAPDFVPRMVLSYTDPDTGETTECGEGCRRMKVPHGVDLEISLRVENTGGPIGGDGVVWDLWFDQPMHPFPGLDLADCMEGQDHLDFECWRAMVARIDYETWGAMTADRLCLPSAVDDCSDVLVRVPMDSAFAGSRRTGTYHFSAWVDRVAVTAESNEFDNFAGPIRVTVEPGSDATEATTPDGGAGNRGASADAEASSVVIPRSPKPYVVVLVPEEAERGFSLASERSTARLEFAPSFPGEVTVEVDQGGTNSVMIVSVRKILTDEVLIEERGRGRIHLKGDIGAGHLKDDRRLVVEVVGGSASRGLRGTIRVSYPARALYRLAE